ncbi:hypothetical protein Goshw_005946 [Gossypium schwendimanii]|nr:hypothetical protein [Gossypium schwendimanii]
MMTSVWLQEECEGQWRGNNGGREILGNNSKGLAKNNGNRDNLDLVLGINLEGGYLIYEKKMEIRVGIRSIT